MIEETTEETIPPHASTLIESMRDIGYSFQTATADIIDNSLAAGARKIGVNVALDSKNPHVSFLDDGHGMSLEELREAMRPGTKGPLANRSELDLGRFGLGLKTASFSQCRRLTVASRRAGGTLHARTWDLDLVEKRKDWVVQIPTSNRLAELGTQLTDAGTFVRWEKLDRLADGTTDDQNRVISDAGDHFRLVYHRFLSRRGSSRVTMTVNGIPIEAFDPFLEKHPATLVHPAQTLKFPKGEIQVQGFTIPHHEKMSDAEYKATGLGDGHAKNQGFYLYRRERLIMHGGWFGIVRPSHTRQLSRVRVDVPAEMDAEWRVDIKKSSAQLPPYVRAQLKNVIEELGHGSKRTYTWKGRITPIQQEWGLWNRRKNGGQITYEINNDHEAINAIRENSTETQQRILDRALSLIAASLPLDTIFSDFGSAPTDIRVLTLDEDALKISMQKIALKLTDLEMPKTEIRALILALPQFGGDPTMARNVVDQILDSPQRSNP